MSPIFVERCINYADMNGGYLLTIIISMSPAFLRIRIQISMVNIVLLLLNMEVSEDMSADIMTASMSPRAPVGMSRITRVGYATFVQPTSDPQNF